MNIRKYCLYQRLAKYVETVYDILKKEGVGKGDIVGVDISKGVWQIASVLGILFAEALYVPLDTNQPLKRKEKIVNSAGINLMLTEQENLVLSNNCIAKAEIGFLCREKNQNKKRTFRILEVGAGVGGTSLDVIPSLDGMEEESFDDEFEEGTI